MLPLDRGVLIDFNKFEVNSGFIYRQKDNNGYKIIATLSEDNIPIPLADTTVSINIELNEVVTVATMTIESETQGIVSYILPECFVATSGTLVFDISVIRASDSIQLTSPKVKGTITVPVDKDTAIECSDELPILLDLIQQVQDILDESADFMLKVDYDSNDDGTVNNSDGLQGQAGSFYLDRANHTGTQTASTISDFDTEVSNNPAVVLNTAKVSFPEAPIDGKQYGRKDAAWTEVVHTGDMTKAVYDPTNINADAFSMDNMVETTTKKILIDTERNKLTGIADGAEVNVQSDWNQATITEDDYIKNKPTDVTDLSTHSVTELNDVTNAGSGLIITAAERTQIGTNTTDISDLDTYVKDPQYTQDIFNVSSIESIGIGFESDLTTPVDVSASFVESQLNDLTIKGETYNNFADNGVDYVNHTVTGTGTTKGSTGIHLVQDGTNESDTLPTNLSVSTQYTLFHNVSGTDFTGDFTINATNSFIGSDIILSKTLGENRTLFTTSSTITSNQMQLILNGGTDTQFVDYKIYGILEGDYTTGANANKEIGELKFGINNTLPQKIKSVGVNIAEDPMIPGIINNSDGTVSPDNTGRFFVTDFIKLIPNSIIFAKNIETPNSALYDGNRNYVRGLSGTDFSTTLNDGEVFIRATKDNTQTNEGKIIISYIDIPFEPYEETILYTSPDIVLRSIPNGIQDKIDVDENIHIKKISDNHVMQSGDVGSFTTTGTNKDFVRITLPSNKIAWTNIATDGETIIIESINTWTSISGAIWDTTDGIFTFGTGSTSPSLYIFFPKGTYADLAAAQAALAGTELIYQLAQPITADANTQGNLIAYKNGTKTYDPFIRNEFKYATGITISNPDDGTNLKILEVEKAFEIVNDEYVLIDSSRISLSGDLETITISGATNGNFYTVYALLVSSESTVPESSYSLSVNSASQIQQNQVNNTKNSNRILTLEDKVSMLVAEIDDKLLP